MAVPRRANRFGVLLYSYSKPLGCQPFLTQENYLNLHVDRSNANELLAR